MTSCHIRDDPPCLQATAADAKKNVAIKALSLRRMTGWKQLELFEREAKVLKSLSHPGIPRYIDFFEEDSEQDRGFFLVQVQRKPCVALLWAVRGASLQESAFACRSLRKASPWQSWWMVAGEQMKPRLGELQSRCWESWHIWRPAGRL